MKTRMKLILIIIVLLIISFFLFDMTKKSGNRGFDLTIYNETNSVISGLYITYNNISKEIKIDNIQPKKSFFININPQENFSESSMLLSYKDSLGNIHKETILGYFEKGYSGKISVRIISIDSNGILTIKDDSKIN